jgi:hypothetical protein
MRGVRVVTATFTALSVLVPGFLLVNPPRGNEYFPVEFAWQPALFGTLVAGALGTFFAARFGGRIDDIRASELPPIPDGDLISDDRGDQQVH